MTDEKLKERAREFLAQANLPWTLGESELVELIPVMAAFASSIQEEGRPTDPNRGQVETLLEHYGWTERFSKWGCDAVEQICEALKESEQQLAEARAQGPFTLEHLEKTAALAHSQGMREAAEIARYYECDGDLTQTDVATGIAAAIEQISRSTSKDVIGAELVQAQPLAKAGNQPCGTAPRKELKMRSLSAAVPAPAGICSHPRCNGRTHDNGDGLEVICPAIEQMQGMWRSIDDAPKDGSHILAADFSGNGPGFGGIPRQSYQCVVHWWEWGDGTHQEEWGWYPSTGAGESNALANLTHWKPLEAASPVSLAGIEKEKENEKAAAKCLPKRP